MAIRPENQHIQLAIAPAFNVVERPFSNRPNLEDLISQCDPSAPMPMKDAEWDTLRSVGNELL